MTSKTKDEIKAFFETGDKPSQSQFEDFIDSYVDKSGPIGQIETAASANTQGFAFCSAARGEVAGAAAARAFLSVTTTAQASALAAEHVTNSFATTAQAVSGAATGLLMNPVTTKNAIQAFAGEGAKVWINFDGTGTIAIRDSYNVDSIADDGTGTYTVTITTDFAVSGDYALVGGPRSTAKVIGFNTLAAGSFKITTNDVNGAAEDMIIISAAAFGDQ